MSTELRDLYQETIIDHARRPRNFGPLPEASHQAEGFNPLCGDRLTLRLKVVGGLIEDARFEGVGCAISTASASLMTEALKGLSEQQAETLFLGFHSMLTGGIPVSGSLLGKLEVLTGVREFPSRIKCATLAWHALHAALHAENQPVSTE
ncbi:iron-sulfur cluster assembly scaffold protein [Dechloromonas denitrificans]|uniref:Iron-sulfur cluster assembly scaffold protein n=1 Tax=Dechloromonas denitrificans TaxID=281362 RepID=A0A133XLI5_9RHOO|nr:SUF system NifU family Fe-S cluster assembly protein [Dechloromonas denitrificans]KXB31809.1 iron-sulfur cluster assembly scaffold protein [Dechloromonas denitrificans]